MAQTQEPQMYVRYIGHKVCWTMPDEAFYVGDREELTAQERAVCESGGGYMPVSEAALICASQDGRD